MKFLFYIICFFSKCIKYIYRKEIYKSFNSFGKGSYIETILRLQGAENISIGNGVGIHKNIWLGCLPLTDNEIRSSLNIGQNVLTANNVYISDNLHNYENPNIPICKQSIRQLAKVSIGEGSWLGEHVCVIGASVGKHCVIGANSVVTRDIPDYSVAVGSPAVIIKKYDFNLNKWIKV